MTRTIRSRCITGLAATALFALIPGVSQGEPAPAPEGGQAAAPASTSAAPSPGPGAGAGAGELGLDDRETRNLFRRIVDDAASIHDLHDKALAKGELTEAGCLGDAAARADDVVAVADRHLADALDPQAGAAVRQLGGAGVDAAAEEMDALVEQASNCPGDNAPDEIDDNTDTNLDKLAFIPFLDPTRLDADAPGLPATRDDVPPAVYSPIF